MMFYATNSSGIESELMADQARKVLIIEDDPAIVEVISLHIKELGYTLDHAQDGESGLRKLELDVYHLVILDLGLPGIGGIEVCKRIRSSDEELPILMLSGRGEEVDKVTGFTVGADDYMTKPFSERELALRVQTLMKRAYRTTKTSSTDGEYTFGSLTISLERREVAIDGALVDLTPTEFAILSCLVENAGKPITKQRLVEEVGGYSTERYEATLGPHISRLRGKLEEDPANPKYIKTAWGVGYYFCDRLE